MIYGFNSEDVAYALKGIGEQKLAGSGGDPAPTGREVIFVKTPEDGIPARDGDTVEEAECKRVYLDEDLELQLSDDQVVPVANTSETNIEGDIYVKAVMLGVNWVAVTSGGSAVEQIVATTEITAASGLTVGTGSGSIHSLNSTGDTLVDSSNVVNIRNPWEEVIESGSMMTCHNKGDYYLVIQASCPSS